MQRYFTIEQEHQLDKKISELPKTGTIIAIGGGFDGNKFQPIVDECIAAAKRREPHVLFVPTARWDEVKSAESAITLFQKAGCTVEILRASIESLEDIHRKISEADIFYATGGNLKTLLTVWRNTGMVEELQKFYRRGGVLCGSSSGAMCWARKGWDDYKKAPKYKSERKTIFSSPFGFCDGLDFLPFCICPHFDSKKWRKYEKIAQKQDFASLCIENGVAVKYHGGIYSLVKEKPSKKAYIIEPKMDMELFNVELFPPMLNRCSANRL